MNPVSILLVAGLVGAVYWAVMFGPAYADNFDVREAVAAGIAQARNSDESIKQLILIRLNVGPNPPGWHFGEDSEGNTVKQPGLGIPDEGVQVFRDEAARTIRISVDYSRTVRLIPTQSQSSVHFHVEKEAPLPQ